MTTTDNSDLRELDAATCDLLHKLMQAWAEGLMQTSPCLAVCHHILGLHRIAEEAIYDGMHDREDQEGGEA